MRDEDRGAVVGVAVEGAGRSEAEGDERLAEIADLLLAPPGAQEGIAALVDPQPFGRRLPRLPAGGGIAGRRIADVLGWDDDRVADLQQPAERIGGVGQELAHPGDTPFDVGEAQLAPVQIGEDAAVVEQVVAVVLHRLLVAHPLDIDRFGDMRDEGANGRLDPRRAVDQAAHQQQTGVLVEGEIAGDGAEVDVHQRRGVRLHCCRQPGRIADRLSGTGEDERAPGGGMIIPGHLIGGRLAWIALDPVAQQPCSGIQHRRVTGLTPGHQEREEPAQRVVVEAPGAMCLVGGLRPGRIGGQCKGGEGLDGDRAGHHLGGHRGGAVVAELVHEEGPAEVADHRASNDRRGGLRGRCNRRGSRGRRWLAAR